MAELTMEQMKQVMAKLLAENEALKKRTERKVSFKVGEKGGVSIYGINSRFPVTLYANQWEKLLSHGDDLRKFIKDNQSKLSVRE